MNYEDMIKGLISGELKSPQIYGESFYINLRITGTGITERYKEDENNEIVRDNRGEPVSYKINRSEEEFLSDTFLKACQGIPVLIEHPDNNFIDGGNYKDHVIGTIIQPFIKEDLKEVWGVARIYDPEVLILIQNKLKSTSPAVRSINIKSNNNDIVEEKFKYIDHLALVIDGYWDDYSNKAIQIDHYKRIIPNSNNSNKEDKMPEELEIKKDEELQNKEDIKKDNDSLETENNESDKIKAIHETLNQILEALKSDKTDSDEDEKKDEEPSVEKIEKEEEAQANALDTILEQLQTIVSMLTNKDNESPVPAEDFNDKLNQDDILNKEDEAVDIEEEEEVNELADKAYALALSYKEDGVKYIKKRDYDTPLSYIGRFLNANKELVAEKYKGLAENLYKQKNKKDYALAVDAMKSIDKNLKDKADSKNPANKPHVVYKDDKVTRYENIF